MSLLTMTHHYTNEGPKLFQTDRLTDRQSDRDRERQTGTQQTIREGVVNYDLQ